MKRLFIFLIPVIIFSCKQGEEELFYPIKDDNMAEGIYQKYKSKLDTAYLNKDHFEIGVQLSNLNAPSNKTFEQIEKGIKENSENCFRIYEWHKLFVEHNFQTNLVKLDTLKFINSFKLCEKILGQQTFIDYQTQKELEYQMKLASREPLDSTKFDLKLMEELKQIELDDQRYRHAIDEKGISETEKQDLWKKQNELDSINLVKVANILKDGYPAKEKVGYENVSTIWLVIHHQGDYEIRQKYLPLLKKAVEDGDLGKGALKTFQWRDELIRLQNDDS